MTIIKTYVDSSKGIVSYLQDPLNESVFEVDGVVSASSYLGMNYSDITVGTATTGSSTDIAGYYMSVYIESISPISGSAMASEPTLISLDLRYRAYINQ